MICSLPINGGRTICYDPDAALLFLEQDPSDCLPVDEESKHELWYYFLGLRKLKAIKNSMTSPKALIIEPSRLCNLMCKYCYAHAGPYVFRRIRTNSLLELIDRNNFENVFVFGGDPLTDKKLLRELYDYRNWMSFVFSTNGILIDKEFVSSKLVNSTNVTLEIALEPEEWGARVNINGTPQMNLLKHNLPLLKGKKFVFWIMIPRDSAYVPLRSFIDSLTNQINETNFAIFYWSVYGPILSDDLPTWFDKWITESQAILTNDELRKKYASKIPAENNLSQLRRMASYGFYFYDTSVPGGAISVGPDNKLHAWHERAILEDTSDIISSNVDPLALDLNKSLEIVYKWANGLNNQECEGCSIRYFCGGLYLDETPGQATCQYLRKTLTLDLTNLAVNHPNEVHKLVKATEQRFKKLCSIIERIKREVPSKTWDQLVQGELPLEEAINLANQLL